MKNEKKWYEMIEKWNSECGDTAIMNVSLKMKIIIKKEKKKKRKGKERKERDIQPPLFWALEKNNSLPKYQLGLIILKKLPPKY